MITWNGTYELPETTKELDISYLAGLFDGEGCIPITRQKPGEAGRINPSHRLYVKVTIGQRVIPELFKEKLGVGTITVQKSKKHNEAHTWWAASREAFGVLHILYPYLIVKKNEAEIAFEFENSYWQRGSSARLPKEVVEKREELFHRMQEAKPSHRFRVPKHK